MFVTKRSLPRRTFLRGAGTALALPLLDAMVPALTATAATDGARRYDELWENEYFALGMTQAEFVRQVTPATLRKFMTDEQVQPFLIELLADPERGQDIETLGMISGVIVKDGHVAFARTLDTDDLRSAYTPVLDKAILDLGRVDEVAT